MPDSQYLQHVYLMPGMAANPSIFDNIQLSSEQFVMHKLEWFIPKPKESLSDYAMRMCDNIKHDDIVLIGVSFGGVLVQEMAKHISFKRLIIISSVKSSRELPKRMQIARKIGLYKMLPTSLVNYMHHVQKLPLGKFLNRRVELYKTYLSISDKRYLDWAIKEMVCWSQHEPLKEVVHIHGDADIVFPISNLDNPIVIKGGTHIMIINKYRWFNRNLPHIIATGNLPE